MPTKNGDPTPTITHSDDGAFVHYGFTENGVFHPISSERTGDYEERIKTGQDED